MLFPPLFPIDVLPSTVYLVAYVNLCHQPLISQVSNYQGLLACGFLRLASSPCLCPSSLALVGPGFVLDPTAMCGVSVSALIFQWQSVEG